MKDISGLEKRAIKTKFVQTKNMAVSAIDKEFLKYFIQLDEPQKKSLLELIKTFLNQNNESKVSEGMIHYNKELDEAMERISKGGYTTLDELEREMKSW